MFFINNKKIFFALSGILVALSLASPFIVGLNFGIDFTGGSLIEVRYEGERPEQALVETNLNEQNIGGYSLRGSGESAYLLRSRELQDGERDAVLEALALNGEAPLMVERTTSVGPVIGEELKNKAFVAIAIVVVIIVLYVAFAFRHVEASDELKKTETLHDPSSFVYGVTAILALIHDIALPFGLFSVLGILLGAEIDILFVMALLAILGYSVNDTIVIFDRVRENLRLDRERNVIEPFATIVGRSLEETYARSINTSLTTILVLVTLYFLGGSATQLFALTLIAGIIAGTYSSIALAPSLLVAYEEWSSKKSKELKNKQAAN